MTSHSKSQRTSHEGEGSLGRWYPLFLIVITLGVFFPSLFMEFTYDDRWVVLEDPRIRQGEMGALWNLNLDVFKLRPVRTLTYMVDYAVFGFWPAGYHLHNLFWHVLCVVLVFMLLKKVTHQATFSFFGALIFAIHPIHVEAVSNITNRKELLALGFLLIAFLCYIRFLEGTTARKWGWFFVCGLSWGLGIFSKQVAIILPFLLFAYELLLVPKDQRFLTKNIPLFLALLGAITLPLVLYAFYILANPHSPNFPPSFNSTTPRGYRGELTFLALIATSARAFWTYIQLLVWPAGLCPDHVVDLSTSFLDLWVLLAWAGLTAFIILSLWVSPKWPVLAFGMLWFIISFIPISNLLPSAYILADRYMYMPSVGYCMVVVAFSQALYGWLSTTHPQKAIGITSLLAAALTVGYTSTTLAYNPHWRNQQTLFTYVLQCHSESGRAFNGLGNYYFEKGMYVKAKEYFSQAIAQGLINAEKYGGGAIGFLDAYNNRGNALYELGEYQAALDDYTHVISIFPEWGKPYSNRGIVYLAQKQYDRAVEDFTQALEKLHDQSRVYNVRGLAYEKLNNWTKAREDYTKAISSDPSNGEAYFNLGRVQLHNDELDAAILSYKKAKELGWEQAEAVLKVMRKKGYLP